MAVNQFLVRWEGGWAFREDAASVAAVDNIEAFLNLGALSSLPEVYRVADGQLAEFARERVQTDIAVAPDDATEWPYDPTGWMVGDIISVEGNGHRVLGVTVTEDNNTGRAIPVPTLNDDVILSPDERVFQAMRKMINGTLGGRSKVAQPVVPVYVPRGLLSQAPATTIEQVDTAMFEWDEEDGDGLVSGDRSILINTAGGASLSLHAVLLYRDDGTSPAVPDLSCPDIESIVLVDSVTFSGAGSDRYRLAVFIVDGETPGIVGTTLTVVPNHSDPYALGFIHTESVECYPRGGLARLTNIDSGNGSGAAPTVTPVDSDPQTGVVIFLAVATTKGEGVSPESPPPFSAQGYIATGQTRIKPVATVLGHVAAWANNNVATRSAQFAANFVFSNYSAATNSGGSGIGPDTSDGYGWVEVEIPAEVPS